MTSMITGKRRNAAVTGSTSMRLKLAACFERVSGAVTGIAIALACLLSVPILFDVAARTAGHPTDRAFEYTLYALIGVGFLANAWA